jgi:hypothetical protein
VKLIHERSGGIPRTVSVICDNALVTGFAMGRRLVDKEIVAEVARDFDLREAKSATASPAPTFGADAPSKTEARPSESSTDPDATDDDGTDEVFGAAAHRRRFSLFRGR